MIGSFETAAGGLIRIFRVSSAAIQTCLGWLPLPVTVKLNGGFPAGTGVGSGVGGGNGGGVIGGTGLGVGPATMLPELIWALVFDGIPSEALGEQPLKPTSVSTVRAA